MATWFTSSIGGADTNRALRARRPRRVRGPSDGRLAGVVAAQNRILRERVGQAPVKLRGVRRAIFWCAVTRWSGTMEDEVIGASRSAKVFFEKIRPLAENRSAVNSFDL
ncbi:hypothetical protein Kisp02_32650 [Kineosporia sp. NBRC 101731]|nr:hypothetical protein Kisp02_32650 [Kineosporia sp. NBRC 101731]